MPVSSWGGLPHVEAQRVITLHSQAEAAQLLQGPGSFLAHGLGRSYGDVCLHRDTLLHTQRLRRILAYDREEGTIDCEAGCSLGDILSQTLVDGWTLPVLPGTQRVSVGGAIANDVHGKNHQHAGTFGRHVEALELLRSDGQSWVCSPEQRPAYFAATIGGLGLTGLILRAKIKLQKISGTQLQVQQFAFKTLEDYFALAQEHEPQHSYTVAWLDCLKPGCERGVYWAGDFCQDSAAFMSRYEAHKTLTVPRFFPSPLMQRWSLRAFNAVYYHWQASRKNPLKKSFESFFFPLDRLSQWNRVYGKQGFFQYQFVLPFAAGVRAFRLLLSQIHQAQAGAFLAVLKNFGSLPSPGLLSFPLPGYTLALDLPNRGPATYKLLTELDALVLSHGGRVYPAKDARMSAAAFAAFFPALEQFRAHIDPKFSSAFWERVQPHATDH